MKRLGLLLILFSIVTACQKDYGKIKSPNKFLPIETTSVIQINELNDFINSIENHDIISGIYNKELKTASDVLKNINTTKQLYIGFNKNSDYIILAENDSTLFVVDSIPNHISETITNLDITKTEIDSTAFYHKTIDNVFIGSNNLEVLKTLNTKNENKELNELLETSNNKSIASVIFKTDSKDYSKLLLSKTEEDTSFGNFTLLDLNYTDKSLQYNGIITSRDSIQFKIDCFKNTIPQKINTIELASYNTQSLLSIAYDDFSVFNSNRNQLKTNLADSTQTFLNFSNEVALVDNAIMLHTLDTDLVLESIENKSMHETFRDIEIYKFGNPDFFESKLQPFITYSNAEFFLAYKDFVVFSNSTNTLKSIISNALTNNTLINTDAFKNISDNLSDESSIFIYKNSKSLSDLFGKNLKGYNANAVQYIYEDNYAHINGVIQKFKKRYASNTVTEAFSTTLDTDLILAPQSVKNHVTKAHDIVVQDVNNILYLISSSGSILWRKQLQGKILGKIEQIDMYKNGRLQLAFATPNRLYVLDRNGNDVSPFPLKFNDEITQPLSVFDYDKRKNYRLLITQGKNLLMYDSRGNSVGGFKYSNNSAEINTQPKHFRIGSKDYIVFAAGENLKILNRQGNVRINVKDKIRFSGNSIYLHKNKFTTTNTLGQLVQVDTKGKLTTKNLSLPDKHKIEATSKTLISMTENKLSIKSRTVDLDYGDYTEPRIFYLNDKIYVTITDLQSKKVYLYDSQAKPIPNFPVFGNSAAELQKLDKDKGLELITQADDKTLVVYKIN